MRPLRDADQLLSRIRAIHEAIRDDVLAACETRSAEDLAAAVGDEAGDTVFEIDRVSEASLLRRFEELARDWPLLLVAEGLGADGRRVLPTGTREEDTEIVVLVDPIDGTRGLMYQKRPAWILTGVAAARQGNADRAGNAGNAGNAGSAGAAGNGGAAATLGDIVLAVQTEIPLVKQHLSDTLWATAGVGARAERFNRLTGERIPLPLHPSRARGIRQGYGGLARFFPGARGDLAAIDDDVVLRVLGPIEKGRAATFEDQYISTGGQLYELIMGHDRWMADLRPLVQPLLRARGQELGLCCHPYDLSTELIAREAGVLVTGWSGDRLSAPLDVFTDMAWMGYANAEIRAQVEPALAAALRARGLLPGE